MSNQFDWDFEEITNEEDYQEIASESTLPHSIWLYVLIPILLLAGGGYWFMQTQFQKLADAQTTYLTSLIDTQTNALAEQDFDLYFSLANASDSWKLRQLTPENRAFFANKPTIKMMSEEGSELWVTLAGELDNEPLERILFFLHSQGVATEQISKSLLYWGDEREIGFSWGTLFLNERDREFEDEIVQTVMSALDDFEGEIVVKVVVEDGERPFSPNTLHIPSPRLIGLTPDGNLSNFYRTQLSNEVAKLTTSDKTPIRFAVPDDPFITYTSLAEKFTAATGIPVELITITDTNENTLANVDAAAITPTVDLIVNGHLQDLSDFAFGDDEFEVGDFYGELWDGASWHERIWMIPQEAEMNVLLYARDAYRQRDLAFPTVNWTWDDLAAQSKALTEPSEARYEVDAGILSPTSDLLYAYAFSNYPDALNQEAIDATLDWYRSLEATNQAVPLSKIVDGTEREYEALQYTSYPPSVGFWIAAPNSYEYFIQYLPVGVMPFPAANNAPSSPPLYVTGHVMSSSTQNPYNTWEWLKFLSYNPPIRLDNRHIPARRSVAFNADFWPQIAFSEGFGFWSALPDQLGVVMRETFQDAQAVPLDKQDVFSWEAIAAQPASAEALRELDVNDAVVAKRIVPKVIVERVNGRLSQIQWHNNSKTLAFYTDFPDYSIGESGWSTYTMNDSIAHPVSIDANVRQQLDERTQEIIAVSPTGTTLVAQAMSETDSGLVRWTIADKSGLRELGNLPAKSIFKPLIWSHDKSHVVLRPSVDEPFADGINFYVINLDSATVQPIKLDIAATFSAISANGLELIYDYGEINAPQYALYNIATGTSNNLALSASLRNPSIQPNSDILSKDFARCTAVIKETFSFRDEAQKSLLDIPCDEGLYFDDFGLSSNKCTMAYTVRDLKARQYYLVLADLC